jgi:hypothetical protein
MSRPGSPEGGRPVTQAPLTSPTPSSKAISPLSRRRSFHPKTFA